MNKRRVLVAGFFHETHSFLEGQTRLEDFEIRHGQDLLGAGGDASPMGGVLAVAHRRAYGPIAGASYSVDTPGPCSSNLRSFPYRKVRWPIYPLDDRQRIAGRSG